MVYMERLFWNKEKTQESFRVLRKLAKELDFVLIGGWAVYYYVRQQESLDVDIALDYSNLTYFNKYGINQYEGMKIKYSIIDDIYVDIFLSEFSDKETVIPVSRILEDYVTIEGMKVVRKELLLLLKLNGYFRNDETKVRKDIIDVVTLLFYADINLKKVKGILDQYKIEPKKGSDVLLEYLDKGETLLEFIGMSKGDYSRKKAEFKAKIKEILE